MEGLIGKIEALTLPLLEGTDMFITSIRIKPTNNVKLFLDADSGLSVEKSAKVNRRLYALIEESAMFADGDFSLEVSSPGVDEPLSGVRQYRKNVQRTVAVTTADGKIYTGVLTEVGDDSVTLELPKKGKQQPGGPVTIPVGDIKSTVVQIVF